MIESDVRDGVCCKVSCVVVEPPLPALCVCPPSLAWRLGRFDQSRVSQESGLVEDRRRNEQSQKLPRQHIFDTIGRDMACELC